MKLLFSILLFSALWGNAQESKPKVSQQMYLEPNVGIGRFHYHTELGDNEKHILPTTSLGLYFKSPKLKLGLDLNYCFELGMISPRIQACYNLLNPKSYANSFTGPLLGFGVSKNQNNEGLLYLTIGLDNYYRNFHFAVKYDMLKTSGSYSFIKNARMLYLEVGYAIHLGFPK